ncbi:CAIB/BAIF family enzyme [Zopfia rhizophila CBS 207.26]|uniref:CAIB/BAIF family enzyme n=1 Tax=Zopfia rhizophila CBS 207.26 TaxID=1314779 RepID=A0A6A6DQA0_9PEZI|nr:CAIB/BAIF family enzyme [Zopfia rhizophila CBS 207.26]
MAVGEHVRIGDEAFKILDHLLLKNSALQIPPESCDRLSSIRFTPEAYPIAPTPCKLSESALALWALVGVFSALISEERYNLPEQTITIDVHTATLFPMSCFMFELDGKGIWHPDVKTRMDHMDLGKFTEPYRGLATNIYKTRDDRYFQLHGSLNTTATLNMLQLPQHRHDLTSADSAKIKEIYADEVAKHDAEWLDIDANEFWRQAGTICLTHEEFLQTPHGQVSKDEPLYTIDIVHHALPPVRWPSTEDIRHRPLAGIKVLDLTRVVAGPTISKTLAPVGADMLRISSENVPEPSSLVFDMQIGKRDCSIDLKSKEGKLAFRRLLEDVDVIIDGYRPGAIERMGFSRTMVHEIANRRGKGIIYARENCYGWLGEWKHRSGWQQISDCVTGVSWAQGKFLGLGEPVIPLLPNSDYQTGIVGAAAILQALRSRATSGGSYNVDTSLNAFNLWYLNLGLHSAEVAQDIRAKHPTRQTCKRATGEGAGELFDPARFTAEEVELGNGIERATYLDWTKIVTFSSTESAANGSGNRTEVRLGYDRGPCMPGSHKVSWY